MRTAAEIVAVYGGCILLHVTLNAVTRGRWTPLMMDLFRVGGQPEPTDLVARVQAYTSPGPRG